MYLKMHAFKCIHIFVVCLVLIAKGEPLLENESSSGNVSDSVFDLFLDTHEAIHRSTRAKLSNTSELLNEHQTKLADLEAKLTATTELVKDTSSRLENMINGLQGRLNSLEKQVSDVSLLVNTLTSKLQEVESFANNVNGALGELQRKAITSLRLSSVEGSAIWKNFGYEDTPGFITTGVYNFNRDEYTDYIYRRRIELYSNGQWRGIDAL